MTQGYVGSGPRAHRERCVISITFRGNSRFLRAFCFWPSMRDFTEGGVGEGPFPKGWSGRRGNPGEIPDLQPNLPQ